jgi:hypothetical protein
VRDVLRHLLHVLAVAVAVSALAAWPAWLWGADTGLLALGLAAGVCLIGAVLGRVVLGLMLRLNDSPEGTSAAIQAAIGVRLLGTLVLCLPVVLAKWVPNLQLAVWLVLHYVAQLVLELFVLLRELGQNPANGSAPPDAGPPGGDGTPPEAT